MNSDFKQIMTDTLLLFFIQTISYTLIVINFRAVAQADYMWSGITDFVFASFNFFVIKKIAKSDDTLHLWLGYALGGLAGSFLGIWISLLIQGQ